MKNLQQYVDQKNVWETAFGRPGLDINNASDRQSIANAIDCDLSPENLSCDGELSIAQVRARYRTLTRAADELKALDPTVSFLEY